MWIGFDPPGVMAWTIDGAPFVGDSDGSHLTNGQPRSLTRFQWPAGAQTTGTTVKLRATFASTRMPDIGALLNVSLPAGTKIDIACRADGGSVLTTMMGGNAIGSRTVHRADGTVALAWGFDKVRQAPSPIQSAYNINITGIELTIYNDVNGVSAIPASSMVDLGELMLTPAYYIPLRRSLSIESVNRQARRAVDNTLLRDPRYIAAARSETYDIRTSNWSAVSNAQGELRAILERASKADRALFIPRWHADGVNASGAWSGTPHVNYAVLNDTALFGRLVDRGPIKLTDDVCWDTTIAVAELV